jgi:hypothetical protein
VHEPQQSLVAVHGFHAFLHGPGTGVGGLGVGLGGVGGGVGGVGGGEGGLGVGMTGVGGVGGGVGGAGVGDEGVHCSFSGGITMISFPCDCTDLPIVPSAHAKVILTLVKMSLWKWVIGLMKEQPLIKPVDWGMKYNAPPPSSCNKCGNKPKRDEERRGGGGGRKRHRGEKLNSLYPE